MSFFYFHVWDCSEHSLRNVLYFLSVLQSVFWGTYPATEFPHFPQWFSNHDTGKRSVWDFNLLTGVHNSYHGGTGKRLHKQYLLMKKLENEELHHNSTGLSFTFKWQHPVCSGCSISDPAPWESKSMAQILRPVHLLSKPERSSRLLISDLPTSTCCSHLDSKPVDGRFVSLCLCRL